VEKAITITLCHDPIEVHSQHIKWYENLII